MKRDKFTPVINRNTRSLSLTNFQTKTDPSKKINQKPKTEFLFELPKVLDKKFNATDKASPITMIKYSGNFLIIYNNVTS